ncbi:MAG: hypothetical protein HY301_02060 [Verrucomicrobia bacterium]|nr:hypothetical protein [Verrucomicrobiota bacterium]
MKLLRRLHLYLGVFFAPLLLFFVITGWYQTVNRDRLKSPSEAESLTQKFRVVHTDQIYPGAHEVKHPSSPKMFNALLWVMTAAITVTVLLGVWLAFKTLRTQWPVWVSLAAGLAIPILFLWLGNRG